MTQVAKIKEQMGLTKGLVIHFSDVTEEERDKLIFETACQWAENHSQLLDDAAYLTRQAEFWGWWKLQWMKEEEKFTDAIQYFETLDEHALVVEFGTGRKLVTEPEMIGGIYRSTLIRKMLTCKAQPSVMESCMTAITKYNRI